MTFLLVLGINQNLISQNKNIEITAKRNPDKSVDFLYTKKEPGSYYVKIEFPTIENSYRLDFEEVVKNNTGRLFKLKPINRDKPINFTYTVVSIRGNPNPKINKDFLYVLPFKTGTSVSISESSNLKETYFNAKKDPNWNSFIVDRKTADTIYNMRKGIVIEVIDEFETDSLDAYKYNSKMNKILIEHEDGTISRYKGFNRNSIFVKPGQTVYPQTKLGALDIFNNYVYRLYFDIYYIKELNFDLLPKRTLSSEDQSQHLNPYFYSSKGPVTLENNEEHIVEIDDTTRFMEFTKREKKLFAKSPETFK